MFHVDKYCPPRGGVYPYRNGGDTPRTILGVVFN